MLEKDKYILYLAIDTIFAVFWTGLKRRKFSEKFFSLVPSCPLFLSKLSLLFVEKKLLYPVFLKHESGKCKDSESI